MVCVLLCVMNKGQVAEYDTPSNLLKHQDGLLAQLVRDTNTVSNYE